MPAQKSISSRKTVILAIPAAILLATGFFASQSLADNFGHRLQVQDPVTKKECGDCHMAYPAALLSQGAWRSIMNDLPNHFGEDASLDEASRTHIENYLTSHTKWQARSTSNRISEQRWFTKEHRHEVSDRQFANAKSWSNCPACHKGADRGNFEHENEHKGWLFGDRD